MVKKRTTPEPPRGSRRPHLFAPKLQISPTSTVKIVEKTTVFRVQEAKILEKTSIFRVLELKIVEKTSVFRDLERQRVYIECQEGLQSVSKANNREN